MVNLIGTHKSRNGAKANYPERGGLSWGGHGLGEQHPDTIVIFREDGQPERPPDLYTKKNPDGSWAGMDMAFAEYWHNKSIKKWREVTAAFPDLDIYFTLTSEAVGSDEHELPIYCQYVLNRCELAKRDGFKCVVGKLANGTPHFKLWQQYIVPMLVEAWDKYGAIYGRHVYGIQHQTAWVNLTDEYVPLPCKPYEPAGEEPHAFMYVDVSLNMPGNLVETDGTISKSYPGYPYRIIDELEYLKSIGYGGGVFLCEVGLDGGYGVADWNRFHFQITKFEQALRPYADILIGFAWWECGETGWHADYTNYLKQLEGYMTENSLPKWEPREVTEPPTKHKAVVVKIPQEYEKEGWFLSADWAHDNYKRTQTASTDDMMTMLQAGNAESYAVIIDPWLDSQQEAIKRVGDAAMTWVRLELGIENNDIILPIPQISQNGETANERKNDCGAAASAMVIHGLTERRPTVDDVAKGYQKPPNTYMDFGEIEAALNHWGVDGTDQRPFYTKGIEDAIRDWQPVIALVKYPSLPRQFSTFQGCHFIVIYGIVEDTFLYRDPLQGETNVMELFITPDELTRAMYDVQDDGNLPAHGMTCKVKEVEPPPPTGKTYNTADFMIPDPRSWVVVDRGAAGGEDIWTVFKDNQMIRVKNRNQAEWYTANGLKRIRDTSPADDPTHGPCLYLQYTNGNPGGQIAPEVCEVGVTYTYYSDVQFKAKKDCRLLDYRSGNGRSTFQLKGVIDNHTFPNGVKVDRLFVTVQTGEIQLYAIKDGVKRGWCGGGAEQAGNTWTAIPREFYLDRKIPQDIPPTYCG